jgi:hypothetical protein
VFCGWYWVSIGGVYLVRFRGVFYGGYWVRMGGVYLVRFR